jgi:hypothetical protein
MSDQEWDVLEFFERFRNGEFDGHLREALDSLSSDQIEDLESLLLVRVDARDGVREGMPTSG